MHHAGAAVRVRALHHPLPGRPARLLDHDEHLDDRPAARHPASGSSAAPRRSRRAADRRGRPAVRPRCRRPPAAAGSQPPAGAAAGERASGGNGDGSRRGQGGVARPAPPPPPRSSARRSVRDGAAMSRADASRGARPRAARAHRRRRSGSRRRSRSTSDDETLVGTLHGEDLGLFIGRHGQTIDAVQHLALADRCSRDRGDRAPAGRRRRRRLPRPSREALRAPGRPGGRRGAAQYGRPVALDAMTASERKLVHEYLRDRGDVETYSEGEEPDRHLVVAPRRVAVAPQRPFHVKRPDVPSAPDVAFHVERCPPTPTCVGLGRGLREPLRTRRARELDGGRSRDAPATWSRPSPPPHDRPRSRARACDVHLADSLVGARPAGACATAARDRRPRHRRRAFPGLALAVALPDARVALVESVGAQVRVPRARRPTPLGLANVEVVNARAEEWRGRASAPTTSSPPARWRR